MAVAEKLSVVDSYMDTLQHARRSEVETLRRLILDAVPELNERIKWNAPSFGKGDDDRITMRCTPAIACNWCCTAALRPRPTICSASRIPTS